MNATPGPWDAYHINDYVLWCIVKKSNGVMIEPSIANAHLIAAAPDMYEALKRYIAEYQEWEDAVTAIAGRRPETGVHLEQARAAIAKAEGRDNE